MDAKSAAEFTLFGNDTEQYWYVLMPSRFSRR